MQYGAINGVVVLVVILIVKNRHKPVIVYEEREVALTDYIPLIQIPALWQSGGIYRAFAVVLSVGIACFLLWLVQPGLPGDLLNRVNSLNHQSVKQSLEHERMKYYYDIRLAEIAAKRDVQIAQAQAKVSSAKSAESNGVWFGVAIGLLSVLALIGVIALRG